MTGQLILSAAQTVLPEKLSLTHLHFLIVVNIIMYCPDSCLGSVPFSSVAQSCPTLCDPGDCSPPGSSVHGILQTRILMFKFLSMANKTSQDPVLAYLPIFFLSGAACQQVPFICPGEPHPFPLFVLLFHTKRFFHVCSSAYLPGGSP